MKKLLLHACCAPCAVYVYRLLSQSYDVTCFFHNPNIQPESEYRFREKELKRIAELQNWKVIYGEYNPETWNKAVEGLEEEPERGRRCSVCFNHRLRETFRTASKQHFDIVASTLSISPYKDAKQINKEGESLSEEFDIPFLAENFKKQDGYSKANKLAHDLNIKHQNYCGCLYSKEERERRLDGKRHL